MEFTADMLSEIHGAQIGVYTQTLIESPVVRWILYARVRDNRRNDVVLVGNDFIHVEELERQGHLRRIATKQDFNGQILAASILRTGPRISTDELVIKKETDGEPTWQSETPSEKIVLALSTDELVFIHLHLHDDGTYRFFHHTLTLPSMPDPLYSLGEHLCVDPESRAIAVAAMERNVWISSIKDPNSVTPDFGGGNDPPWPTAGRFNFEVPGIIQNMSFLTPQAGDEDHVILLLIVVDSDRTKAICIDWYHSLGLQHAQQHPGQALDSVICMSSLLIPLKDASFLLVKGQEIIHWKNLVSGSATAYVIPVDNMKPKHAGISPREPIWVSWSWPFRNDTSRQQRDDLYLIREDGLVFLLTAHSSEAEISFAGDLDCHVGTAFAALGDEFGPDILAAAGDMSNGQVVAIGTFHENVHIDRTEVMDMCLTQWLPNWASNLDMIPTDLGVTTSPAHLKHSHGFYVTAGCQPYGSIVELRRGMEVQTSAFFGLDGLKSVTDVWALPDVSSDSIFIIISRPTATQLLQVSTDITEVIEVVGMTSFITSQRTLAAGILSRNHLVQVTPHNITIIRTPGNSSDAASQVLHDKSVEILMAVIVPILNTVAYVCCIANSNHVLNYHSFNFSNETDEVSMESATVTSLPLEFKPLCIATTVLGTGIVIVAATSDNRIAIKYGNNDTLSWCFDNLPEVENGDLSVCDHIAILHPSVKPSTRNEVLVVCGLKDGRIITYQVDFEHSQPFRGHDSIIFSNSAVRIVQFDTITSNLVAISGTDMCLLEWIGGTPVLSSVENIWASDKSRPELSQGSVATCTMMPPADTLSSLALADSLIMVSQDEILVGSLQRYPATVPKRIPVSGTPNRLIYCEELRCLVCSSECAGIRPATSSRPHGASNTKRQRWPVIDFIPLKSTAPSFTYTLQPGTRIHALLPWSHRSSEGKTYSYVLVGGSYLKSNGVRRGRVSLLQPLVRNREVTALLNEPHNIKFDHEVLALGKYDANTFIACSGNFVCMYRFFVGVKKWDRLCLPYQLASPGVCISTQQEPDGQRLITISTARDSTVVLSLQQIYSSAELEVKFKLVPIAMDPEVEVCQSHLTLSDEDTKGWHDSHEILTLVSTKNARLVGLKYSGTGSKGMLDEAAMDWKQAETVFRVTLTGSLIRLRKCEPFERKGRPPAGVVDCRIVGSRTDGAIVGVALLDRHIWRRLAWLQLLCQWSEALPYSTYYPPYDPDGNIGVIGEKRRLLMGLGDVSTPIRLQCRQSRSDPFEDYHIDGDVIGRVLRRDGLETLKKTLRLLCETPDESGAWMRKHLVQELQAADEIVEVVRSLHSWM